MDTILIPIVGMLIPIIIVPTALGLRHARFLREVEHAERMRAMELGRTLAEDESWTPANIAVAIGAGVPIVAMFIAFVAGKSYHDTGIIETIWKMAGMVGLAGVLGGSALAAHSFTRTGPATTAGFPEDKPAIDPDAFDVVGTRG